MTDPKLHCYKGRVEELSGSPVVKTACSHCQGLEFNSWLRNQNPIILKCGQKTSHNSQGGKPGSLAPGPTL